jgi:hypothetical protein
MLIPGSVHLINAWALPDDMRADCPICPAIVRAPEPEEILDRRALVRGVRVVHAVRQKDRMRQKAGAFDASDLTIKFTCAGRPGQRGQPHCRLAMDPNLMANRRLPTTAAYQSQKEKDDAYETN